MRICKKCGEEKPITDFVRARTKKDGTIQYRFRCKKCNYQMKKRYRQSGRGKERHQEHNKRSHLKRKYGLTPETIYMMWMNQKRKCPVCKKKLEYEDIVVDHCHTSGKVRGLLHGLCNSGIGMLKDSVERLKNAIEYLEKNDNVQDHTMEKPIIYRESLHGSQSQH
jgi:hypothetical protein